MIFLITGLVLFIAYGALITYYWRAWASIPYFVPGKEAAVRISVIIPARNEEENLGKLLDSLAAQEYPRPLYEVIVVDDHSTDSTAEIAGKYAGVRLIRLQEDNINSYKKKAIETGIGLAEGDLIVCTDADCLVPPRWLRTISSFKEERNAVLVAAPVVLQENGSLLQRFQVIDFMVLQGITGAAVNSKFHSMSNGANLAYERKLFLKVGGFGGIDTVASGDDVLLMQKMRKSRPGSVLFLKSRDAMVQTGAQPTWREFFNQRVRWASKAAHYKETNIYWAMLIVYLFNLFLLATAINAFWDDGYFLYFLGGLGLKMIIEYPFLFSLANFFQKRWVLLAFPLFQPFHVAYIVISGLFGQFGKYEWKGRKVR